jgi:hypothetical protein
MCGRSPRANPAFMTHSCFGPPSWDAAEIASRGNSCPENPKSKAPRPADDRSRVMGHVSEQQSKDIDVRAGQQAHQQQAADRGSAPPMGLNVITPHAVHHATRSR